MSREALIALLIATVLSALGMWLMLPRGNRRGRYVGAALGLVGMVLFGTQLVRLSGGLTADGIFLVLAFTTVASAVGAVTLRSPVYCAIWFALMLVGVAGLFLYQGAQFLGVATIVVYAGAILVTFLFVLMLAQPEGHSYYDRVSWESLLSASAGAVLVGMLTMAIITAFRPAAGDQPALVAATAPADAAELAEDVLHAQHVARLGANLFGAHLIAVEVAGVLLLVALVGAVAIAAHQAPARRGAPHV